MLPTLILVIGLFGLRVACGSLAQAPGIHIPLQNAGALAGVASSPSNEDIVRYNVHIFNKYQRNIRNVLNNTGRLPDGWTLQDFKSVPSHMVKRAKGTVPLTFHSREYTGAISIGNPPQPFTVLFDTGAADTWVVGVGCTMSIGCKDKPRKYNKSLTGVAKPDSNPFEDTFGDDLEVSGPIFTDNINVAGLVSANQYFSAISTASDDFAVEPEDGILGLASSVLSQIKRSVPFIQNVASVDSRQLAFRFTDTAGTVAIGGPEMPVPYSGSIELHDTVNDFWSIAGASIVVGGSTPNTNLDTVIDTGADYVTGPPKEVAAFYKAIPGWKLEDAESGTYSYPCDALPAIGIKWGSGKAWAFSPQSFAIKTLANGRCLGAVVGTDPGGGEGIWIVGTRFLKNMYTVFDYDNKKIGFATLKAV